MSVSLAACPKTSIVENRTTPRVGERDASRLERQIEKLKSISLERFIYALGIRHVGEEIARILAREYGTLENFLTQNWDNVLAQKSEVQKENEKRKRKKEELAAEVLRGIGEKIVFAIRMFLSEKHNIDAIRRLEAAGVHPVGPVKGATVLGSPFSGKRVLLTGAFERMSQTKIEEVLRNQGAEVANGFRKDLDVLIVGAKPGGKLRKAEEAGIEIMHQDKLFEILEKMK